MARSAQLAAARACPPAIVTEADWPRLAHEKVIKFRCAPAGRTRVALDDADDDETSREGSSRESTQACSTHTTRENDSHSNAAEQTGTTFRSESWHRPRIIVAFRGRRRAKDANGRPR
jgi:hypothetical protein